MLCVLLLTLKGTPFIYQGQEIGMTNFDFTSIYQIKDVESHNVYRMAKRLHIPETIRWRMIKRTTRDNARTPMQWNDGFNAGFTTGKPWLPVNPNYTRINVESQINNADSIRNFYKTMIKLRAGNDVLKYGNFEALKIERHLFAYKRTYGDQSLIIALNFSPRPRKFNCSGEVILSNYKTGFSGGVLKPYEAVIIKA